MTKAKTLEIWTIYDKPKDYPSCYIARKFYNNRPTTDVLISHTLEPLRARFQKKGLVPIPRSESDPLSIVESWL